MSDPASYFDDPNEKLLATTVWEIAGKTANDPAWTSMHPANAAYAFFLPYMTGRVVRARDWITNAREQMNYETGKDDGGVHFINDFFEDRFKQKTNFTATQIANVEHFFVAAMYSDMTGPAVGVPVAFTAVWEFGVGPLRIHFQEEGRSKSTGEPYRSRVVIENIKENARQFKGPDRNGFIFGESTGAKSRLTQDLDAIVKASLNNPSADPVSLSPTKYTVSRRRRIQDGESLSIIAKRFYKDPHLWPLIWFANQQEIGTNYNVVKSGTWLSIPFLSSVTDQMARCKTVDANWKPGFDWR
jgi:hypothetical protein